MAVVFTENRMMFVHMACPITGEVIEFTAYGMARAWRKIKALACRFDYAIVIEHGGSDLLLWELKYQWVIKIVPMETRDLRTQGKIVRNGGYPALTHGDIEQLEVYISEVE